MGDAPERICQVEVLTLKAPFSEMYDEVPNWLSHPAANQRVLRRNGQCTTLVKVRTVDGLVGIGEAFGLPAPEVTASVISEVLGPLIIGLDAKASTQIWHRLYESGAGRGHNRGFYLEAIAGIDLALWDLRGKLAGEPVHRLLGGPMRETIECYASPVPLHESPEESARSARMFVDAGFRAIKVKIGRGPRIDRSHLSAVRTEINEDVEVLVDANCAYDLDTATQIGYCLRELGISWYEEPLSVDDLRNLAELRRRTGLTVVNGETHSTAYDLRESLYYQAIDVFMPNLARCGGITEALRIAALASAFHVDVAPHGVGSGVGLCAALQFSAGIPNLRTYEYNQLPNPLRKSILRAPPAFRDGVLHLPEGPGLGFELDDSVVSHYMTAKVVIS